MAVVKNVAGALGGISGERAGNQALLGLAGGGIMSGIAGGLGGLAMESGMFNNDKARQIASGSMGSFKASSITRNLGQAGSPMKKTEQELVAMNAKADKQTDTLQKFIDKFVF